jgi:hypothetical protein
MKYLLLGKNRAGPRGMNRAVAAPALDMADID